MVKLQPKKVLYQWGTKVRHDLKISIFSTGLRNLNQRFSMFFSEIPFYSHNLEYPMGYSINYYIWQFPDKNQQTQPLGPISVRGFSLWGLSKSQRPFSAGNVTILFETHWWWCWQSHSHGLTVHSPDQWEWSTTLITKKQPHTDTQAWIW